MKNLSPTERPWAAVVTTVTSLEDPVPVIETKVFVPPEGCAIGV
jgi:hypothetical protein